MKKKVIIISSLCVLVIICFITVLFFMGSNVKPLETLDTADITSINVLKLSDGLNYKAHIKPEFLQIIKNLSIKKEIENIDKYTGKIAEITLKQKSGDSIELKVFDNRIMINSVMYEAKSETLNPLTEYIAEIKDGINASVYLESPPPLEVICGDKSVSAHRGASSWNYGNSSVESDSSHPLMWEDSLKKLNADSNIATLSFAVEPYEINIVCYSDEYLGNYPENAVSEQVEVKDNEFTLKSGGCIYVVNAKFSLSLCGGQCTYGFYVNAP